MKNYEILTEAMRYYSLGFSIIPVGKYKKPLVPWKMYQEQRATPDQIATWFEQLPDINIGVVTGAISGIVVIDVEKGGDFNGYSHTATVETGGGGRHFYYKHPGILIPNSARKIGSLTDVRGDAGYVVLPPSIHQSGHKYQWLAQPEDGISQLPTALLAEISGIPESQMGLIVAEPVAVGKRNITAAKHIGSILGILPSDLWESEGWPSLREWNRLHADPPLDENELRSVFDSIAKREEAQRRAKSRPQLATQIFAPYSIAELYQEKFPISRWVVKDLIPCGTITAITGDSNSYKSFFTQSMATSIVTGEKFLGEFPTIKGRVLIIDEENHRRQIKDRFQQMGLQSTDDILFLSLEGVKIDRADHIEQLLNLIEAKKPVLVIFDSLVRLHGGEENNATEMAKAFSGMKKLVGDDRAIIFIHHHRKQKGFGNKSSTQSIRGSSDILAAVDTHLAIDRDDTEITVTQTKMRLQPEIKPFKARLVPTMAGTLAFSFQGEDTSEEDRLREAQDAIKSLLDSQQEPLTTEAITEAVGLPVARVRQAIKRLTVDKVIEIAKKGAHGTHFYRSTESA